MRVPGPVSLEKVTGSFATGDPFSAVTIAVRMLFPPAAGSVVGSAVKASWFPVPTTAVRVMVALAAAPVTLAVTTSNTIEPGEVVPAVYVAKAIPLALVALLPGVGFKAPLLLGEVVKATVWADAGVPSAFNTFAAMMLWEPALREVKLGVTVIVTPPVPAAAVLVMMISPAASPAVPVTLAVTTSKTVVPGRRLPAA